MKDSEKARRQLNAWRDAAMLMYAKILAGDHGLPPAKLVGGEAWNQITAAMAKAMRLDLVDMFVEADQVTEDP